MFFCSTALFLVYQKRRVRDLNPRDHFWSTGFRNRRIQPLCQLSSRGRKSSSWGLAGQKYGVACDGCGTQSADRSVRMTKSQKCKCQSNPRDQFPSTGSSPRFAGLLLDFGSWDLELDWVLGPWDLVIRRGRRNRHAPDGCSWPCEDRSSMHCQRVGCSAQFGQRNGGDYGSEKGGGQSIGGQRGAGRWFQL